MELLEGLAQIGLSSNHTRAAAAARVRLGAGHPAFQVLVVEVREHDHLDF